MTDNGTVHVTGEVVSVKPKWDRFDKNAVGVVVKADNKPFWFRWSPQRGALNQGDTVELTGNVTGQGEPKKKGDPPMTFLSGVQIVGTECGHAVVTNQGGVYYCDSCGTPMTVAPTASLEAPRP